MSRFFALALALSSATSLLASPLNSKRQSITTLSSSQVSAFKPYSYFASAAYCAPNTTINWSCGDNCNGNAGFVPTASGGDGSDVQYWYVGYDPALNTVVVAHQGTDPAKFESDLTDAKFFLTNLDSTLFPGLDSSIEVHNGFASEQADTATTILAAVEKTLSAHPGASVTTTGHSLGAALALLDAVYLPLHLPSGTSFKTVVYGMPRVGNQAFADYVDAQITSLAGGTGLTHINNEEDPIPIVPGRSLGFVHPSGEVHIQDSGSWDACPGQDNTSDLCIVGDVPNIADSDLIDHLGPYNGVVMGVC
ncbi:hypothetical protein M0805_003961 [Coniferiporia weirii]|nr:hypothetical protein M0805_003961 [Coniferiporia weirii]